MSLSLTIKTGPFSHSSCEVFYFLYRKKCVPMGSLGHRRYLNDLDDDFEEAWSCCAIRLWKLKQSGSITHFDLSFSIDRIVCLIQHTWRLGHSIQYYCGFHMGRWFGKNCIKTCLVFRVVSVQCHSALKQLIVFCQLCVFQKTQDHKCGEMNCSVVSSCSFDDVLCLLSSLTHSTLAVSFVEIHQSWSSAVHGCADRYKACPKLWCCHEDTLDLQRDSHACNFSLCEEYTFETRALSFPSSNCPRSMLEVASRLLMKLQLSASVAWWSGCLPFTAHGVAGSTGISSFFLAFWTVVSNSSNLSDRLSWISLFWCAARIGGCC